MPDKTKPDKRPPAPANLGARARRLWVAINADYDLDEHELALAVEVVRTVDLCERLDEIIHRESVINASPHGERAHPAAVELRQQRITLARLLAALRMPAGDEDDQPTGRRPQRRTGARGTYRMRGPA